MGLVTPLGNDVATTWKALLEGVSGVGPITKFDASEHSVRIAAEVKQFDPLNYLDKKMARRTGAFTHYAYAAAREALDQSGLDVASMSSSCWYQLRQPVLHTVLRKAACTRALNRACTSGLRSR